MSSPDESLIASKGNKERNRLFFLEDSYQKYSLKDFEAYNMEFQHSREEYLSHYMKVIGYEEIMSPNQEVVWKRLHSVADKLGISKSSLISSQNPKPEGSLDPRHTPTKPDLVHFESHNDHKPISSYEDLFNSPKMSDLKLYLSSDASYFGHKFVLLSASKVFRDLIEKAKSIGSEPQTIILPKWFKKMAFEAVLKFLYRRGIKEEELLVLSLKEAREFLLVADYLEVWEAAQVIAVYSIIPKMSGEYLVTFIKDSYRRGKEPVSQRLWSLIYEYCLEYFVYNSKKLIYDDKVLNEMMDLSQSIVVEMIERSLTRASDGTHLFELVSLLIDHKMGSNLIEIMEALAKDLNTVRYFDEVVLPFNTFLRKALDSRICYKHQSQMDIYTNELNINLLKNNSIARVSTQCLSNTFKDQPPVTTFFLKSFPMKSSFISKCFDTLSRCWRAIVVISEETQVGFFLQELGPSEYVNRTKGYHNFTFTSVFVYLKIEEQHDGTASVFTDERFIYHSFPNDQYHCVGFKHLFTPEQIRKNSKVKFSLWICEKTLQAACLQHISSRFSQILKAEQLPNRENPSKATLNSMNPFDIFSLLVSDSINVKSEKELVSFLSGYIESKAPQLPLETIEILLKAIRFSFVEVSQMFDLARNSSIVRSSEFFRNVLNREFESRLAGVLLKAIPRNCYESGETSTRDPALFRNELITWLLSSEHQNKEYRMIESLEKKVGEKCQKEVELEEKIRRKEEELKYLEAKIAFMSIQGPDQRLHYDQPNHFNSNHPGNQQFQSQHGFVSQRNPPGYIPSPFIENPSSIPAFNEPFSNQNYNIQNRNPNPRFQEEEQEGYLRIVQKMRENCNVF